MEIINVSIILFIASKIFGYIGLFFIVLLEYSCFPMSSEILLPFIGVLVAKGEFTYLGAISISIVAGIMGSLICYCVGYWGGQPVINFLRRKIPKSNNALNSLQAWFDRYGKYAVLFTRLVPLTRTYVSFLAGAEKLKPSIFISYSAIGISIWNTILILAGYFLGGNIENIKIIVSNYSSVILIVITTIISGVIIKKNFLKS